MRASRVGSGQASLIKSRTIYSTGCEASYFTPASPSSGYCIVRAGFWSDPSTTYCGALHNAVLSVATMALLALLATVAPSWM